MKKFVLYVLLMQLIISILHASEVAGFDDKKLRLWYDEPAGAWHEAMPIGNGRLGGMVFGGVSNETITINEDTVWSGGPHDYTNVGSHQYLQQLRSLIRNEKYAEASDFGADNMLGVPRSQKIYQTLGRLLLAFTDHHLPENYRRQLNLAEGIVKITYSLSGANFTREILASNPDQVIAIRLTCDQPGKISFQAQMTTPHGNFSKKSGGSDSIILAGSSDAIRFQSQIKVINQGGNVSVDNNRLKVSNADSVTILLAAATNYVNYQDVSADPDKRCRKYLAAARRKSYAEIKSCHVADHSEFFGRVHIDLGASEADTGFTTDKLLQDAIGGRHVALLEEQLFQFGRYMTIAGARAGAQPMNLVGIWAEDLNAPWGGKWTLNINAQLNAWPVETTNLSECHKPLLALLEDLRVTGSKVAREHYGCGGFVAHHNTDLWRGAAPVDTAIHGLWPMGGAWLCRHIWEHYDFSRDIEYLSQYYPTMKEAAEFFFDYLTVDQDGNLSTCPSISFEQGFKKKDGTIGRLTYGPTMDNQILRDLFTNCIAASEMLNIDESFRSKLINIRARLRPTQIDPDTGRIMEWAFQAEKGHNSGQSAPLWGVSPGRQITPQDTPELAEAAVKYLENLIPTIPGYENGGSWVTGTLLNAWARLGESEQAYGTITKAIRERLYPNLMMHFYTQKYFEIDGNMGTTSGITEMLMQSHRLNENKQPIIDILPALADNWPAGSIKGLRARGAFVVDIQWQGGLLKWVTIKSLKGTPLTVCYGSRTVELETTAGSLYCFDGQLSRQIKITVDNLEAADTRWISMKGN